MKKYQSIWDVDEPEIVKHNCDDATAVGTGTVEGIVVRYGELKFPNESAKSFEELGVHPSILEGLYANGIVSPNQLQKIVLPYLMKKKERKNDLVDVIVHAPHKAGKTTSALISMSTFLASTSNFSKAIIICPTFESVSTIYKVGRTIAKYYPELTFRQEIRDQGGQRTRKQKGEKITERIIIGTPEKIKNLLMKKLIDAMQIDVIMFDEVDVMVSDRGHKNPLLTIISILSKMNQLIMLSSQSSNELMEEFVKVIGIKRSSPYIIEDSIERTSTFKPNQFFVSCKDLQMKKELLSAIIAKRTNQIVIICKKKVTIEDLYNCITQMKGLSVSVLYAKLSSSKRQSVKKAFKDNKVQVLITTPSFDDLQTPSLKTVVCYDHYRTDDWKIDYQSYQKWMTVLDHSKQSLLINFVEERDALYLFKTDNNLPVIQPDMLKLKLNEIV